MWISWLPDSSISWTGLFPGPEIIRLLQYLFSLNNAFPRLQLLPQLFHKIKVEGIMVILIVPVWPRRKCYADIVNLLADETRAPPHQSELLLQGLTSHLYSCWLSWCILTSFCPQALSTIRGKILAVLFQSPHSLVKAFVRDFYLYALLPCLFGTLIWPCLASPFEPFRSNA